MTKESGREAAARRYGRYINSRAWAQRRRAYFETHARKCAFCGKRTEIELHHHTYARMGRELDDDLVPLCATHHTYVHQFHKAHRGTLTTATRAAAAALGVEVTITTRRPRDPDRPTKRQLRLARRERNLEHKRAVKLARAERKQGLLPPGG